MEGEDIINGRSNLSKIPWQSPSSKTSGLESPLSDTNDSEKENLKGRANGRACAIQDSEINGAAAGCSPDNGSTLRSLRHVSVKICEKVQSGNTTYNDVADDLIRQLKEEEELTGCEKRCDDKNVRRRVYDALNVLMAVDVIAKENNKDIRWKGIPDESQETCRRFVAERDHRKKKIKEKQEAMIEQLRNQVSYRNLVIYNQRRENVSELNVEKIPVPFITLNAHPYTEIHCDASRDLSQLMIDVNAPFAVHDDNTILRCMGL